MKVEMGKEYKTKSGQIVRRVLCADRNTDEYPVVVEMESGEICTYTSAGAFISEAANPMDLVEITKWHDFKIDDKVMVRKNGSATWYKRYFSGDNGEGKPTAFHNGGSLWSNINYPAVWDECRRPTEEELE